MLEKKIKREKEQVEKRKRKEDRIVSMVMVMRLALMVYSLAEHKLREAREKENEVIPDQRNKPTKKPTITCDTFQVSYFHRNKSIRAILIIAAIKNTV